jgi:glycosyltransferase involved in cell wall biosynthesis
MTKRVLLIGPWPPPTGGVATHVSRLADLLEQADWRVKVLGHGAFVPSRRVSRIRLERGLGLQVIAALPIRQVIHGHSVLSSYPVEHRMDQFIRAVRTTHAKWVESLHDETLVDRLPLFSDRLARRFRWFLSQAEVVVASSPRLGALAIDLGIDASRIMMIRPLLPTVTEEVQPLPDRLRRFVEAHEPLIVAVGAKIPTYDLEAVAKVFAGIRVESTKAGLVILSSGFASDARTAAAVGSAIEAVRADVLDLVDLPPAHVRQLFRAASVVVRGVIQESFGLTRVEAMLEGTPVVATPTGAHDFVEPYEFGREDSLRLAIERALSPRAAEQLAAFQRLYRAEAEHNFGALLAAYEFA